MKDFLIDLKILFQRGSIAFPLLLLIAFRPLGVNYNYVLCLFALCVFVFCWKGISMDKNGITLILFSISYTFIFLIHGYYQSIAHLLGMFFSFFVFYYYGRFIVDKVPNERTLLNLILLITLLICIPYYIETINDVNNVGLVNVSRAITLSDEEVNDDNRINATIVGLTVSFGLAGMGTFFSFKNRYKSFYCWLFVAISLLSLLTNIHVVNRTGIIVFIACLGISLYYQLRGKNIGMIIGVAVFILLWFVFDPDMTEYSSDIISAYESRAINDESAFGSRLTIWLTNFKHILTDLFGWREKESFAHNMWIDFARDCGIIPFVFFLVFTIRTIKSTIMLSKIKNNSLICFIIGINTAILLYGLMEPVYQANRFYFYLCCFIWGIQSQLLDSKVFAIPNYNK